MRGVVAVFQFSPAIYIISAPFDQSGRSQPIAGHGAARRPICRCLALWLFVQSRRMTGI
jgi:hypothetical protein